MVKYYYLGSKRIAMRTGSDAPKYLLSDHLGSASVMVNADGTAAQTQGYYPWGETRFGSLETEYQFTGQYRLAALGLDYFNARWYDSALGRFAQADSIVPLASQGAQAWDRYAFVNNNPVRYTDPSGHKACAPTNDSGCDTFEEEIIDLFEKIEEVIGISGQDADNDGFSETPDANIPPVKATTKSTSCTQSTYVECFYSKSLLRISGLMHLNKKQMALLALAVYYDLNNRSLNLLDRTKYDTPLWDAYGVAPGDICYGGQCFPRQEVNYFAQGMYTAASGEKRQTGLITVYAWKLVKYQEFPSKGTLLWFDIGYLMYQLLAGK